MMSATVLTESPRHAPLALWRMAGGLLNVLYNLFGDASDIAARHTLTAKARALMLPWLRAAEALMRRLLLIEAAAVARESFAPARRRAPRRRAPKPMIFEPDQPEAWRVAFRCALDRRRPRRRRPGAPHKRAHGFYSAWPLAERYEALLRVYNDPAPYARRLARRLHAAPHRAAAMLAGAPPEVGREQIAAAEPLAQGAVARFKADTS